MTQVVSLVNAFDAFISGCKLDGTWSSIKTSCVMAGWSNLSGALTPLVGVAPSGFNLASGEYSRASGLKGDGASMYLDTNSLPSALYSQNSAHLSVYSNLFNNGSAYVGSVTVPGSRTVMQTNAGVAINSSAGVFASISTSGVGFISVNRNNSSQVTLRASNNTDTLSSTSNGLSTLSHTVFARKTNFAGLDSYLDGTLSFYSIGTSVNLSLLDNRVTVLMSGIQNAIP